MFFVFATVSKQFVCDQYISLHPSRQVSPHPRSDTPVSYTHLDVYKRQSHTHIAFEVFIEIIEACISHPERSLLNIAFMTGEQATCLLDPKLMNIGAVSYTHLDVYKRQI